MPNSIDLDEERIKNSFKHVKEDINIVFSEIRELKSNLTKIKDKLIDLDKKIDKISQNNENKDNSTDDFFSFSIGNEGVVNNQQQSTTINNNEQRTATTINNNQLLDNQKTSIFDQIPPSQEVLSSNNFLADHPGLQENPKISEKSAIVKNESSLSVKESQNNRFFPPPSLSSTPPPSQRKGNLSLSQENPLNPLPEAEETLRKLSQAILSKFTSLTDRELSVFQVILTLERSSPEVTYTALANALNLSESTVRAVANRLLSKGIPLIKDRPLHKKVSLSIPEELKSLNLLSKLTAHRLNAQLASNQRTLFDL